MGGLDVHRTAPFPEPAQTRGYSIQSRENVIGRWTLPASQVVQLLHPFIVFPLKVRAYNLFGASVVAQLKKHARTDCISIQIQNSAIFQKMSVVKYSSVVRRIFLPAKWFLLEAKPIAPSSSYVLGKVILFNNLVIRFYISIRWRNSAHSQTWLIAPCMTIQQQQQHKIRDSPQLQLLPNHRSPVHQMVITEILHHVLHLSFVLLALRTSLIVLMDYTLMPLHGNVTFHRTQIVPSLKMG